MEGGLAAVGAFFGGIALALLIDRLVPESGNPHEVRQVEEMDHPHHKDTLFRSGLFFALAVAVHNFPEGITVSVPIYHATGSRGQAFFWSFLSGLAEPLGALCAYLILMPFLNKPLLMLLNAGVAGIMIFITFDELLPLAQEYGEHHLSIYGLIGGMLLMALILL